jgi:hypothetical protein
LLRPGLIADDPDFAQVATTIPPWPHRPGGPHVDGLTQGELDGRPGTFSMLAGVWLTDHSAPGSGNLWVWPGTHLRFGDYLAEHGADALEQPAEMAPGPYPFLTHCADAGIYLFRAGRDDLMSRWMERLGTWQFAVFWGMSLLALTFLGGALIEWLLKARINYSFLVPYSFVFALASAIPATIRQRSRRLRRGSQ